MTNKDIKERNVWEFKEFAKAYEEAKKVITLKKGDLAHPGGHVITADPLYYRNDANPYIAAGIEMKEPDQANANSKIMPGAQVIPANEEKEPTDKEIKDATKAATSIVHTSSDAAFTITESFYCPVCKKVSEKSVMSLGDKILLEGKEIDLHYDGCRGWE